MTKKRVFVVGGWGGLGGLTGMMFQEKGWDVVKNIAEADLVQFTGGEDINPALYGAPVHPRTYFNNRRDKMELLAYELAKDLRKPMAGICRGGQLLNAMCGGGMYQDVDKHLGGSGGGHGVFNLIDGVVWEVTSLHHQMMIPNYASEGGCILIDEAYESTRKSEQLLNEVGTAYTVTHTIQGEDDHHYGDAETVFYFDENALCFQGHPEFGGIPEIVDRYFSYIETYSLPNKKTKEV